MVAIDASIYNALGGQRKSAMDYADEYARRDIERQAGRQQVELGSLALRGKRAEFEDYQRDRGEQAAVTSALAGLAPDAAPEQRIGAVRALGTRTALKAADDLERAQIERAQAQAQIDDRKQSAVGQRIKVYREALGSGLVSDPQSAAQWLRAQYDDPVTGEHMARMAGPYEEAVKRIPTDPAGFARWQQQSVVGMDRFLSSTAPRPQQIRAGDRVVIVDMNPNSPTYGQEQGAVDVNATPGQQMVHERALARAQGREDLAANKPPAGYRWTAGGALEPIPGGPADKTAGPGRPAPALTEGQSNALMFAARMEDANKEIAALAARGTLMPSVAKQSAENVPVLGRVLGAAVNVTQTAEQQQVEQAKRNFINALLRKESGAAIGQDEFRNADRQYFPQVGDSPAVIEQKRRNRELAAQTMMLAVPEQARTLPTRGQTAQQPQPQQRPAPQAGGDVLQRARDAIARGAPRDAVIQRLRENGIDPKGL